MQYKASTFFFSSLHCIRIEPIDFTNYFISFFKPTPGSQVLGTAGVPLFITRWTRHPHGESMDAKKIVSLCVVEIWTF
jgi:hypothetical protein